MAIKFGMSQINENAPVTYKRIETAVVLVLIPAFTTFVMSLDITSAKQTTLISCAVFSGAIVKAVGVFLGSDTITSDQTSTTTTPITPESKN